MVEKNHYETTNGELIAINLENIVKYFDSVAGDSFKSDADFTPVNIINFCRRFKNKNANKDRHAEYYAEASGKLELQEVYKSEAQKSNEYALLAHILLAQGEIKSKIVNASDEDGERVFVIYDENNKTMILDPAVQEEVIEMDTDGVYKHYSKKRGKEMLYNRDIRNVRLVSPKTSNGADVADYQVVK